MKNTYVKPELFYESFVLSQHIAGCALTPKEGSEDVCTASGTIGDGDINDKSDFWFTTANASCKDYAEGYCYTNGTITLTTMFS